MVKQFAAHLRFHYRILKVDWDARNFSDADVLEMWFEYFFVKEQLGEIVKK